MKILSKIILLVAISLQANVGSAVKCDSSSDLNLRFMLTDLNAMVLLSHRGTGTTPHTIMRDKENYTITKRGNSWRFKLNSETGKLIAKAWGKDKATEKQLVIVTNGEEVIEVIPYTAESIESRRQHYFRLATMRG